MFAGAIVLGLAKRQNMLLNREIKPSVINRHKPLSGAKWGHCDPLWGHERGEVSLNEIFGKFFSMLLFMQKITLMVRINDNVLPTHIKLSLIKGK